MEELEVIKVAVVAGLAGGTGKLVAAPLEGAAQSIRDRSKARVDRIAKRAQKKAGGRPLDVGDRIAFKVLTEGAVTDDELMADYLGGVLAASGPDDDSGAAVVAQIGRLSSRELLLHFLIYSDLHRLVAGRMRPNLYNGKEAASLTLRVTAVDLLAALGVKPFALNPIVSALARENLIGEHVVLPDLDLSDEVVLKVNPTPSGALLYLWGHGVSPPVIDRFFVEPVLKGDLEVKDCPSSTLVQWKRTRALGTSFTPLPL